MKKTIIVASLILTLSGLTAFAVEPENMGTVNITVLDADGAMVQDAPVYIYGEHKTKFVGGKEVPGTTTLSMPAGHYRISSAIMVKTGDYFDRFTSHEAHVEVLPGDNTVVVLTLKPINNDVASVGFAELEKMGISAGVNLN